MNHLAAFVLRLAAKAAARLYDADPSFRNARTEEAYCELLAAARECEAT